MLTPKEYVERIRKLRKLHRTGLLKADWYRQDRIAAICLCIRATQVYLKITGEQNEGSHGIVERGMGHLRCEPNGTD